jgi:hypothetical protein
LSHRICTGVPRRRLAKLIVELADPWQARQESRPRVRRGGRDRLRAEGAGPARELVFIDRVIATLVIPRFGLPHAAVALFYKVDRSTITRAVHQVRPLPAQRAFAVPGTPELRLRTLADVFAYTAAEGVRLRVDGTEVQVRRPRGQQARTAGVRVGQEKAEHDQTHRDQRREGPPAVARVDAPGGGCTMSPRGAPRASRTCCTTIPTSPLTLTPVTRACPATSPARSAAHRRNRPRTPRPRKVARWEAARKDQSSPRICVEHAIAEPKQRRPLQRYIGRREYIEQTALAIAGPVSDRCAMR